MEETIDKLKKIKEELEQQEKIHDFYNDFGKNENYEEAIDKIIAAYNLAKETICESLNKLSIYDNTEATRIQIEFNKKIEELK